MLGCKLFTVKGSLEDEGDLQAQKISECTHKVATESEDWVKVSALEGVPLCGNKASSTRLEGKIMISKPLLWKL